MGLHVSDIFWDIDAAQKMKFSIKDFSSKCDQIRSLQRIWSHLLKKSLIENFIFCGVAATWRDSVNRVLLEIFQNPQEKGCARVSF